jgi:hypothetical protein
MQENSRLTPTDERRESPINSNWNFLKVRAEEFVPSITLSLELITGPAPARITRPLKTE